MNPLRPNQLSQRHTDAMDEVMTTFLRIYSIGFCGDEECVKMKLTKGMCGYL